MALKPVREQIFKSAGPGFNHKAAQRVYDLVMKMDEDSAVAFAEIVISDVCEKTIEENLPLFQKRLDKVAAQRVNLVKNATMRSVRKGADQGAVDFAKALAEISATAVSKKTPYVWREQDVKRDPSGRFATEITHSQKTPLKDETARALGVSMKDDRYKKLTPDQKAQYQDEYRQIASFLGTMRASTGGAGNQEVLYHVQDKAGNRFVESGGGGGMPKDILFDNDKKIVGVVARPTTLTMGGAAFGLTNSLGERGVRGVNAVDDGFSTFHDSWTSAGDPTGKDRNEQLYGRVGAGSTALKDIGSATGNSKMVAAARLGEFVGTHGAEAEAVIGPSARKTAYRYRGTEKTPDKEMVEAYGHAAQAAKMSTHNQALEGRSGRQNLATPAPMQIAQATQAARNRAPNMEERRAASAVIANHLREKMPSSKLYGLQLASGNTPPSEGVILDAEGRIAAQASGYGDDHYLPFNLKNLKPLKGGEYIRTRSVGGPTSEDIYTGLISGARRVTVVSRSGTFWIEFEDDFRGGRRHNDKARRMTRRYEQILDAVQSQQVDKERIPDSVATQIRNEVQRETQGLEYSRSEIRTMIQDKEKEYKENPELTESEEAELDRVWRARTSNGTTQDADSIKADLRGQAMADKEFRYKLNGPGYGAALKALEEQFPYYIKTDHRPLHHEHAYSGARDRGYVEPGRNRPTEAQAGLYGTSTNKGNKFSASQADYQGRGAVRRGGTPDSPKNVEETEEKKEGSSEASEARHKANEVRRNIRLNRSAVKLQQELLQAVESGAVDEASVPEKYMKMLRASSKELNTPENMRLLDAYKKQFTEKGGKLDKDNLREFEAAAGHANRVEWDNDPMAWPDKPFDFAKDGAAYSPDATYPERVKELRRQNAASVTGDKRYADLSPEEMDAEHDVLMALHTEHQVAGGKPISATMMRQTGVSPGAPGLVGLHNTKQIEDRMVKLHKARALMTDMSEEERGKAAADLKSDPMVVTNPVQTPDERSQPGGALAGVTKRVEELQTAAEAFEDTDDPDDIQKSNELRNLAKLLKDERSSFRTEADINARMKEHPEIMALIYEANQRTKNVTTKREE